MALKKHRLDIIRKRDQALGFGFLIAGIIFLVSSFAIYLIFIAGTNFKQQYREHQHAECLQKGNSQQSCDNNYPL